jgi:hypothetical protein
MDERMNLIMDARIGMSTDADQETDVFIIITDFRETPEACNSACTVHTYYQKVVFLNFFFQSPL